MKHLVLVGACYLDTILTVPQFPQEDSKQRATALQVRRGGNCPNTLEVLHQLLTSSSSHPDLQTHLVSSLPSSLSAATRKILSSFGPSTPTSSPIDFSHCLYRAEHDSAASSYIIRSLESGSRTIVNFNDLPEMTADEFATIADRITQLPAPGASTGASTGRERDSYWWHFEGRIPETTLQCIRYLRRVSPGSTVSVEVEKPNRQGLSALAAEADVVFYSRSWAESRGYASPDACLRGEAASSKAASMLCCTWGAEGASVLSLPAGRYSHRRANPSGAEILVVDTVGAGDTFIAGMLYGLICHADDWDQEAKLAFAVDLATSKVQQEGFAGLDCHLIMQQPSQVQVQVRVPGS